MFNDILEKMQLTAFSMRKGVGNFAFNFVVAVDLIKDNCMSHIEYCKYSDSYIYLPSSIMLTFPLNSDKACKGDVILLKDPFCCFSLVRKL